MLIHFGVTPYLVFDGDYLPSKALTEDERSVKRAESRRVGLELYRMGKPSQAHLELQKAVDVTPEMARQLIEELKLHKVQYVVAPYEADAQLAYLERKNIIQGVLSEDSDLLVFGVKRLLTKLDQYGDCVEINRNDFTACRDISLIGWSDAEFRRMAILSGCDYLASINKLGLKTAYRLVRKHKSVEKILRMLQFDAQYRVPPDYLDNFRKAELTFLHQRVFCPVEKKLVMATELQDKKPEEFGFIGKHVEADVAIAVARGDLDPITKKPIILKRQLKSPSPWGLSRSRSIGTPSELKPKKPIDAFFKPRRVPLAELDPNSLTPSPRQRQTLEQQNSSVPSNPTVSSPIGSSPASSMPAISRRRLPRSPVSTDNRNHQPKRLRLCEDSGGQVEGVNVSVETETSRFFSSTAPEQSPSIQRDVQRKKGVDLNIWSDDSIDDTIAGLPDAFDGSKAQDKSVFVSYETTTGNTQHDSQDSGDQTGSREKPVGDSQSTVSTSFSTKTSDLSTVKSFTSSTTEPSNSQGSSQKSGRRLTEGLLKISEMYGYKPSSLHTLTAEPKKTATGLVNSNISSATFPSLVSQYHDTATPKTDVEASEEIQSANEANPKAIKMVKASLISIPRSPEFLNGVSFRGSEDFIIPNSEDESDETLVESGQRDPKTALNIGSFVFSL